MALHLRVRSVVVVEREAIIAEERLRVVRQSVQRFGGLFALAEGAARVAHRTPQARPTFLGPPPGESFSDHHSSLPSLDRHAPTSSRAIHRSRNCISAPKSPHSRQRTTCSTHRFVAGSHASPCGHFPVSLQIWPSIKLGV